MFCCALARRGQREQGVNSGQTGQGKGCLNQPFSCFSQAGKIEFAPLSHCVKCFTLFRILEFSIRRRAGRCRANVEARVADWDTPWGLV